MLVIYAVTYLILFILLISERSLGIIIGSFYVPSLVAFVLKPIYIYFYGPPTLYSDKYINEYIEIGMIIELFSILMIYLFVRIKADKYKVKKIIFRDDPDPALKMAFWHYVWIFLTSIILITSIGGNEIFASNRDSTISTIFPVLRYIYPLIMFGQIIPLAILFQSFIAKIFRKEFYLSTLIILFTFNILNQRGFIIQIMLLTLSALISLQKISKIRAIFIILLISILAIYGKIINFYFAGVLNDDYNIFSNVLEGADGATLQVWSILLTYLENNNYSYGLTLISGTMGIIPHDARLALGVQNITDILNNYYDQAAYLNNGFGFNGTLNQDLYLSFGWFSIIFIPITSYIFVSFTSTAIKYLYIHKYLKFVCLMFITSLLAGAGLQALHWIMLIYLFSLIGEIKYKVKY